MGDKEKTDQQKIKELEDRLAALEPPKPFVPEPLIRPDLYRNMAPPPSAEMVVVGAVITEIVADNRKAGNVHARSSMLGPARTETEIKRGTGGKTKNRLASVPGIQIMDRMLDAADRRDAEDALDRAVRAARLGQTMRGEK